MAWLLIIVILIVLWIIELAFGWIFGGQLRSLVMVAALIYFGLTINKLQTAQTELQKELKRLWKTVKALQANAGNVSPSILEQEQVQSAAFAEPVNTNEQDEAGAEVDSGAVIWTNTQSQVSQPGVIQDATTIPAVAENAQTTPYKDQWASYEFSKVDQSPNLFELWLAGGNWIVRGGLAILFIGLVFLAKFAYENALLPLELRLAAIAGFAVALLVVGWRSRLERPNYGLSLQGGGVAALYLTVFATSKLTLLLPPLVAMALMLLVAVLAAWLAIQQDAMILAVIGTIGGFMVPVLLSTGQGSHIALFSYFAALNVGIMVVALRKAWRPLNVMAFFFTFGIAGLWGIRSYRPEHQLSCLMFLAVFFAIFVVVSILFTRQQSHTGDYERAIDATLLFGVPTVTFGYALYLLKPFEYGGAFAAVTLSAIYLVLAMFARSRETLGQLKMPWAALSLVFATLAIPLAFDARVTSSIWALEGSAVISYGWMQARPKARYFGYFLVFLGTFGFITHWPDVTNSIPILNALTVGLVVLVLAYGVVGTATSRFGNSSTETSNKSDEALTVSWLMAIALALAGALVIVNELYLRNPATTAGIVAPALLWLWALALQRFGSYAQWPQTTAPTVILPLLTLSLPINHAWVQDNLTTQGLVFTVLALSGLLAWQAIALKKLLPDWQGHFKETSLVSSIKLLPGFTLIAYWWLILVRGRNSWSSAINPESGLTMHGWFIPLAAALPIILLWWLSKAKASLPIETNSPRLWQWLHGDEELPDDTLAKQRKVFALLALSYIVATTLLHNGYSTGLRYIPLFNLYELVAVAGLLALFRAMRNTEVGDYYSDEHHAKIIGGLGFVFANSMLSRILSNYFGAEFDLGFAWHSAIAATTYSIVWTLTALVAMWIASRKMTRGLWIVGAALLVVVAAKLILIDLSK
ncbi:MAG: DUF2339 domain-containing protein, partial [Methyloglobulus sp.]|nr:DUF2339 domain-containing protein [Methyloglobulus sp.]